MAPGNTLRVSAVERPVPLQPSQPASVPSPETSKPSGKPEGRIGKSQPNKAEGQVVLDTTVLDRIRVEIKSRLSFFQACADAARRRSGLEIRRFQATWFITAGGTLKELRIEGVPDAQLAACLTRTGSRPFPIPPGMDLTIPTPIVFVR